MAPESRDEVRQRIDSLYDQAENATGNFNATRAMAARTRSRGVPLAKRGNRRPDPALDEIARQWFDAARNRLGPTVPAVLPADRLPGRPPVPARAQEWDDAGGALAGGERAALEAGPSARAPRALERSPDRAVAALPPANAAAELPAGGAAYAAPTEGPAGGTAPALPTGATAYALPTGDTAYALPTGGTASPWPVDGTASAWPTDGTPSEWPADGTTSGWATGGTTSAWPTGGTASAWPTGSTTSEWPTGGGAAGAAPERAMGAFSAPLTPAFTPVLAPASGPAPEGGPAALSGAASPQPAGGVLELPAPSTPEPIAPVGATALLGLGEPEPAPGALPETALLPAPGLSGGPENPVRVPRPLPRTGGFGRLSPAVAKAASRNKLSTAGGLLTRHTAQLAPQALPVQPPPVPTPAPVSAVASTSGTGAFPYAETPAPVTGTGSFPYPAATPGTALPGVPAPESPRAVRAAKAIAFARAQVGKPCVWGATGPGSYDCSSLTQAAWRASGVALPRAAYEQALAGAPVTTAAIEPGDLVLFFDDDRHVGLYVGDGMMVHAPGPGSTIREESIYGAGEAAIHRVVRPA
ncbi:NlpC/P60 family protein [Streptomyces sp. NPDC015171]|uniref:C40 family peptidase n=1 Tax=Streptomyces sp. NPDC015171 TaxID=3364945 RepID=UPI0036FCA278